MDEKFRYTYSAKTHDEVAKIREKYEMPAPAGKLDQLRALDRTCERPGTIAAVIVGVIGTLMMGGGMALIMETSLFVPGIVLGVIGLGIMAAALPVFRMVTTRRRREIAPEILRLSREIEDERTV